MLRLLKIYILNIVITWLWFATPVVARPDSTEHRICLTQDSKALPYLRSKYFKRGHKALEDWINFYKDRRVNAREEADDTLYIPVIVHVVHNGQPVGVGENITAAQVYSQMDVLNEDFNKKIGTPGFNTLTVGGTAKIKFLPAVVDPDGVLLEEPGIHRYNGGRISWNTISSIENTLKPLTQFDPNRYLNIWVVRFGGTIANTLGYAQLPVSTIAGLENEPSVASTDGVVIRFDAFGRVGNVRFPYNQGRTTTHEVGHFLGLLHIWGDKTDCSGTDYCDDTPPTSGPFYGCPTGALSCIAGVPALYQNYLDYTNDACMNVFTHDQIRRMRLVLQHSPRRHTLTTSDVYQQQFRPHARFRVMPDIACAGQQIRLSDSSTNQPTQWSWRLYDALGTLVAQYSTQNPTLVQTVPGAYHISLVVQNNIGADSIYIRNALQILPVAIQQLPLHVPFETVTGFLGYEQHNAGAPTLVPTVGGFGSTGGSLYFTPKTIVDNKPITSGFFTSRYHFSTITGAYLSFDYAYSYTGGPVYDTLYLQVSNNCGNTFSTIYKLGGSLLATDTATFVSPFASQWRKIQLHLPFLNGQSHVLFRVLFVQRKGQPLWLDNFSVHVPSYASVPGTNFNIMPRSVCKGEKVLFSDASTNFPTAWNWTIRDPTQSASTIQATVQNPQVVFQIPGTYDVSLQTYNPAGNGAMAQVLAVLTVHPLPWIQIAVHPSYDAEHGTCTGYLLSVSGAAHYRWFDVRSTNPIATGATLQVHPQDPITYKVVGTSAFGCVREDTVSLTPCISASEERAVIHGPIRIYPIPAREFLYVQGTEVFEYKVFNVLRQIVAEGTSTNGMIRVDDLPSGLYLLYIKTSDLYGERQYYHKILVGK